MKKVVLITGGSGGLGRAIAEILAPEYKVIIIARDRKKLEKVAKELRCKFFVCDITDQKQIERTVSGVIKEYGRVDCLVNNAGVFFTGPLEKNRPDAIREMIDINTVGTILMAKEVLPHMKKKKSGLIININSQAGLSAKPERSIYNASKWAITGFTKCMQQELQGTGVKMTGIYPGKINTDIFKKAGLEQDMGNALDPDKVAEIVKFVLERDERVQIPETVVFYNDEG